MTCEHCGGNVLLYPNPDSEFDGKRYVWKCFSCSREVEPPTPAQRCQDCGGPIRIDMDVEIQRGWLTLRCTRCGHEYERKLRTTEVGVMTAREEAPVGSALRSALATTDQRPPAPIQSNGLTVDQARRISAGEPTRVTTGPEIRPTFVWETFNRSAGGPTLTLTKNGNITLNVGAMILLARQTKLVLMFDRGRRAIGIRPAREDDDPQHVVVARKPKDSPGSGHTIQLLEFTRRYEIVPEKSVKLPARVVDGVLVAMLNSQKP